MEDSHRGGIANGRIVPVGALRDIYRLTDFRTMNVLPGDIPDKSRPTAAIITITACERGFSRPRLDPAGAG